MKRRVVAILLSASLFVAAASMCCAAEERMQFNRDVRPILADNCFPCHGPDAAKRKADLRLDLRQAALDAGAIVPGKIHSSTLIERILSDDADERMPPADSNKQLTEKQKETLKRWIEQGAEYQRHWSYEPPVKAHIAAGKNGVDVLVRKRLAALGLESSPQADRRTLIRRLYSDLVGLPPTPEEVAAFESNRRADAYEKLVEQVLSSKHFGERMAMGWLDVVRFADTIGYHSDTPRNVWPYRDWVIASFNENKPFDRFTIEQIAGDLLPDATTQTRVGSAFNRLLLTTEEGGAQPKDYEARMLTDRVRAIGAVWLGQTTGCAQCHDHKFDPFTTREFYSLGAFFADIQEPIIGRREDGMVVGTPEQQARLAALDGELATAKEQLDAVTSHIDASQQEWETKLSEAGSDLPEPAHNVQAAEAAKKVAQAAWKKKPSARNDKDKEAIRTYYRNHVEDTYRTQIDDLARAERQRKALYDELPKCLVSTSAKEKRTVRILPRGNWMDESGEMVKPALPHYLPQPAIEGRELNRLDLAQWLVSRENPLTARVFVNRLWKQLFGLGLSKVLDDLGAQGETPLNPELLDWLACDFMDSGWDVKHVVRTIVTSQTYRQVAQASPRLLVADPYNREHARQSTFRLDAELVRDDALAISGLLSPKFGGPSVKPYQPEGYWENLNFPVRQYVADTGDAQYSRGLYVWWQRSFLHPSMAAFDAPSREECTAERGRSNIPQQALVLLNDPTYVEAARAFAARILSQCPGDRSERITWAWRQALQRTPRPEELPIALRIVDEHETNYRENPEAAAELLSVGMSSAPAGVDKAELAAWTHVARVLLNLHETITRP